MINELTYQSVNQGLGEGEDSLSTIAQTATSRGAAFRCVRCQLHSDHPPRCFTDSYSCSLSIISNTIVDHQTDISQARRKKKSEVKNFHEVIIIFHQIKTLHQRFNTDFITEKSI